VSCIYQNINILKGNYIGNENLSGVLESLALSPNTIFLHFPHK